MKIKILRPYLDFEQGKTYNIDSENEAKYMIAMSIGKKAVKKDGTEKQEIKITPKPEIDFDFPTPIDETTAADDFKEPENDEDLS